MIQRKPAVVRAFRMIGPPAEPEVSPVSPPAPPPLTPAEPAPAPHVVAVMPSVVPVSRLGVGGLASTAYRPRRDPATGKVIEPDDSYIEERYIDNFRAAWRSELRAAGIDLRFVKCVHGHMYATDYCDVCRLAPIDPDYKPDIYHTEITKALAQASKSLYGEEGKKDLHDLQQIVDIEIWKASKSYGDQMNEKIAFTVAKNQAGKYLTERIEEQTVEDTTPNGDTIRIPRFESMDNKPLDEDGDEQTTAAEIVVVNSPAQGTDFTPVQIEELRSLVATWRGEKRLVGEAMLRPGFTVRGVPGVPKSSAARIRQVVLREFKSFIVKDL